MPWMSNLPISEGYKIQGSTHMATQFPENFVWGKYTTACCSGLVVVPCHTKQTLLDLQHVSHTFFIISKLDVPVATHSCPPPPRPTTSMFFTILAAVMLERGIIKASFYQGAFSNRWLRIGITLKPNRVSSNHFWGIHFRLCGTLQARLKLNFSNFSHFNAVRHLNYARTSKSFCPLGQAYFDWRRMVT